MLSTTSLPTILNLLFKQENINYFHQFKYVLKNITTIILHGRHGRAAVPSIASNYKCAYKELNMINYEKTLEMRAYVIRVLKASPLETPKACDAYGTVQTRPRG
jgi:hypothetical protein